MAEPLIHRTCQVPVGAPRSSGKAPDTTPQEPAGRALLQHHLALGIHHRPGARASVQRSQILGPQRHGAELHAVAGLVEGPVRQHVDARGRVQRQRGVHRVRAQRSLHLGAQPVVPIRQRGQLHLGEELAVVIVRFQAFSGLSGVSLPAASTSASSASTRRTRARSSWPCDLATPWAMAQTRTVPARSRASPSACSPAVCRKRPSGHWAPARLGTSTRTGTPEC